MTLRHSAALLAAAALLALPSAASGHAWSTSSTLTTDGSSPSADMAPTGHGVVGWTASNGDGWVAVAPPGGDFATPVKLATMGGGVHKVAIAENGDAFAAWQDNNGLRVATRPAGGTWGGGAQLAGNTQFSSWDLVAGPDGSATVVANGADGLLTFRRDADDTSFAAGDTAASGLYDLRAGYVGDVVAIAGTSGSDLYGRTLAADGTLSAPAHIDDTVGPPGMALEVDRSGAGAILTWPAYDGNLGESHMHAARAGSDGVFNAGERLTSSELYKGVMRPDGAIAPDGRTLAAWGDAEFDPVVLVEAASPTAAFGPLATPPIPGNRTDDIQVAYDSRGAQLAGWYFSDSSANGTTGRIEVATRLPGAQAWCGPETLLTGRANGFRLRLRFDAAGRGFAVWDTNASGPSGTASVWVSRYSARTDCPPTPPAPPAQEVQQEEVVYLPPPPPPPVVTVVRRFVQLTLPKRASVDRRGRLKLAVQCTGDLPSCAGRLALKRGRAVWATRSFTLAKGKRTVTVTLRKPARRALKRKRRAAVTLEVRLKDQAVKRAPLTLARR